MNRTVFEQRQNARVEAAKRLRAPLSREDMAKATRALAVAPRDRVIWSAIPTPHGRHSTPCQGAHKGSCTGEVGLALTFRREQPRETIASRRLCVASEASTICQPIGISSISWKRSEPKRRSTSGRLSARASCWMPSQTEFRPPKSELIPMVRSRLTGLGQIARWSRLARVWPSTSALLRGSTMGHPPASSDTLKDFRYPWSTCCDASIGPDDWSRSLQGMAILSGGHLRVRKSRPGARQSPPDPATGRYSPASRRPGPRSTQTPL